MVAAAAAHPAVAAAPLAAVAAAAALPVAAAPALSGVAALHLLPAAAAGSALAPVKQHATSCCPDAIPHHRPLPLLPQPPAASSVARLRRVMGVCVTCSFTQQVNWRMRQGYVLTHAVGGECWWSRIIVE